MPKDYDLDHLDLKKIETAQMVAWNTYAGRSELTSHLMNVNALIAEVKRFKYIIKELTVTDRDCPLELR